MQYATYATWRDTPEDRPLDLSVVIPAYTEQERIVPTIGAFAAHLSNTDLAWELIVSDDGSKDATRELVALLGHANACVDYAKLDINEVLLSFLAMLDDLRGGRLLFN